VSGIPGCDSCATPFTTFQIWLGHILHGHDFFVHMMKSKYAWHACETLHFFGLSLLVGTIGIYDMRVLGIGKRIPIASLQQLKPWGIAGFILNIITGMLFLVTFPNQYLYQWPFWFKMLFMLLAGINAMAFDTFLMRKIAELGPSDNAPGIARFMCAASLVLWIGVIFAGRFLAFYKPVFTLPVP
jgi:hypothetical protein